MTELNAVQALLEAPAARTPTEDTSIRPFRVSVSDEALTDKETVADRSQGAQLAMLHELLQYWGSGYDWRKAEAVPNALPQFTPSAT